MKGSCYYLFLVVIVLLVIQISKCEVEMENEIEDELKLLCVLTRHGDRTPIRTFKNSPSSWPEGSGELTGLGARQLYNLGNEYRMRYIEEKKLINSSYHRTEFYAQSSGVFRTLMSADSFVLGLFPPGTGPKYDGEFTLPHGHQSIPIFSDSKLDDFLLYPHHCCERAKKAKKNAKYNSEWKRLEEENKELFKYLSEHLGEPIDLDLISSVVTITNAERIHNRPTLTAIAHNDTLFSHLRNLQSTSLKLKFGSKEFGTFVASNLLREILNRTLEKNSGREIKTPSLVLYSAHDTNILAVFSALDLINTLEIPRYSNHISFEFFKPKETTRSPYVVMNYNFENILIPGCPTVKCPLETFTQVIMSKTISGVDENTCAVPKESSRHQGEL